MNDHAPARTSPTSLASSASSASSADKPTLSGELVTLRPVTEDDVPALLPMFRDPESARLTGSHETFDEPRLRAWYGTRGERDDRLDLAVVERATGLVVGEAVLNEWDPGNEREGARFDATLMSILAPEWFRHRRRPELG
ncbi:GNAT family N-acetyltransferase [Streptomyces sp. NPDC002851]